MWGTVSNSQISTPLVAQFLRRPRLATQRLAQTNAPVCSLVYLTNLNFAVGTFTRISIRRRSPRPAFLDVRSGSRLCKNVFPPPKTARNRGRSASTRRFEHIFAVSSLEFLQRGEWMLDGFAAHTHSLWVLIAASARGLDDVFVFLAFDAALVGRCAMILGPIIASGHPPTRPNESTNSLRFNRKVFQHNLPRGDIRKMKE